MQYAPSRILQGKRLLEQAAAEGDADALCFLARTYLGPRYVWRYAGLPQDDEKAAQLLKQSVLQGSACGVLVALRCKELTPSVRRDMPFSTLREAWDKVFCKARDGHPFCQYLVGNSYYWQDWFPISGQDARTLYARTRARDRAMAQAAVPWFEKALSGGFAAAGHNLTALYRGEDGGCADPDEERRVTEACAALGAPEWDERLGLLLREQGEEQQALACFERAVDGGQRSAWGPLGRAHLLGEGCGADAQRALECFQLGAGDSALAQCHLAWFYYWGELIPQDFARAAYWAGRAAQAPEGEREWIYPLLAHLMLHGIGMPRDVEGAVLLVQEALDFNVCPGGSCRYSNASCRLLYRDAGEICESGAGGPPSQHKAYRAYRIAADTFGDEEASLRLARFRKGLFEIWRQK